jgi:hypothetical protein
MLAAFLNSAKQLNISEQITGAVDEKRDRICCVDIK